MLPLRTNLRQYVNIRPTRILRGIEPPLRECGPKDINWVIVRENSEGEYSGQGGILHGSTPYGVATEVSVFTRVAIERIFRFAFDTAKSRPRKKLTMVTKSNAQRWGMVYCKSIEPSLARLTVQGTKYSTRSRKSTPTSRRTRRSWMP
jgi:isocitrate/isopropylmalate dehydrogenase